MQRSTSTALTTTTITTTTTTITSTIITLKPPSKVHLPTAASSSAKPSAASTLPVRQRQYQNPFCLTFIQV
jgi:hypothetical protein